jgi:hypothetical protein
MGLRRSGMLSVLPPMEGRQSTQSGRFDRTCLYPIPETDHSIERADATVWRGRVLSEPGWVLAISNSQAVYLLPTDVLLYCTSQGSALAHAGQCGIVLERNRAEGGVQVDSTYAARDIVYSLVVFGSDVAQPVA